MHQRLIAPPESSGCLNLAELHGFDGDNAALTALLKRQRRQTDDVLAERFWSGTPMDSLVAARAWAVEMLLLTAWRRLVGQNDAAVALVALGGFGRGELHPHSDVDLLLLSDSDALPEKRIAELITVLWDAGLNPGHSARSVADCITDAEQDVQFTTNLMESRLLAGSVDAYQALKASTGPDQIWPAGRFFEAKSREQLARHQRFHDTAYNLEPNIKEGPGGLRDIQTIGWVAKRHFRVDTLHGLVEHGFLTAPLFNDLIKGRQYLWKIRYGLHLLAGRAEDRLLFDLQRQLAERLIGEDPEDGTINQKVERLMQTYYRTITGLERINERLLQLLDEALSDNDAAPEPLNDFFQVRHGYLEARRESIFLERPLLLLELFLILQQNPDLRGVSAATLRLLRQYLYLLDDKLCLSSKASAVFLALLRQPQGVYTQLQRMNRYGVLNRYLPTFEKVVGRMQFDLFHFYTVDQHILFVVRNLRRFAYGKYLQQFPHGQQVFQRIDKPELLYLAALFHDIAKGRDGDHSELGAEDAANFCEQLSLDAADARLVAWLVRHHLLMSYTAQRKDINDPHTVAEFAGQVGDQRHLDYLYLLTMADIAATSPKLWNSWKDSLLWELYIATGHSLRRGLENPLERQLVIRETRAAALSELLASGYSSKAIAVLWDLLPEQAFLRLTPDQLVIAGALILDAGDSESAIVKIRSRPEKGVTELFVWAVDYDGLFAAVTQAIDRMRVNILTARILTTSHGYSFDFFQIMDANAAPLREDDAERLCAAIRQRVSARQAHPPMDISVPARLQHFLDRPKVVFGRSDGHQLTVMELQCTDRPGLLGRLAQLFLEAGVRVHDARIATFGDRVEDTFVLSNRHDQALAVEQMESLAKMIRNSLGGENTQQPPALTAGK